MAQRALPPRRTVMLVEDDEAVVRTLVPHLQAYSFEIEHEPRGDRAVDRILSERPDAVLLDLNLPGLDGCEVTKSVREVYDGAIIALTVRGDEFDHVLALEYGADDFLRKPVHPGVLIAHLRTVLRRTAARARGAALQFGQLTIDRLSRTVSLGGRDVVLTTGEFNLLWLLASSAGEVVSRSRIRAELRGLDDGAADRAYDMPVSRLRRLLSDDARAPRRIKSVRGKGYLFSPSGWD